MLKEYFCTELGLGFLCFDVHYSFSSFSFVWSVLFKWHTFNLSCRPFLLFLGWVCLTAYKRTQFCIPFIFSKTFFWRFPFIWDYSIYNLSNSKFLRRSFRSFSFLMIEYKSFWLNRFWHGVDSIDWLFIPFDNTRRSIKEWSHHTYSCISTIASCLVSIWMGWDCFLSTYFLMNHTMNSWLLSKFLLRRPWLAANKILLFFL